MNQENLRDTRDRRVLRTSIPLLGKRMRGIHQQTLQTIPRKRMLFQTLLTATTHRHTEQNKQKTKKKTRIQNTITNLLSNFATK